MAKGTPRILTGIPGLDEICGGGLLKGHTYLLVGSSGAGKTVFALQFLHNGAVQYGENGIFLATDERPSLIREHAIAFGWDFEKLEEENKIAFIDGSSAKVKVPSLEKFVDVKPFDIDHTINQIVEIREEIDAKRAVVDSSTSIALALPDPARVRSALLKLSVTLETVDLTSIMTCEVRRGMESHGVGVESFVSEGIIALYYKRIEDVRTHSIEILKMRGSEHSRKVHPFDITPNGILVHPEDVMYGEF